MFTTIKKWTPDVELKINSLQKRRRFCLMSLTFFAFCFKGRQLRRYIFQNSFPWLPSQVSKVKIKLNRYVNTENIYFSLTLKKKLLMKTLEKKDVSRWIQWNYMKNSDNGVYEHHAMIERRILSLIEEEFLIDNRFFTERKKHLLKFNKKLSKLRIHC